MKVDIDDEGLEDFLSYLKKGVEEASNKILDEIATYTLRQMKIGDIESEFQPGEPMSFTKEQNGNEVVVAMVGPQAWYSEFGTGTRGRERPHPLKGEFPLKAYNSGPTIRRATKKVAEKEGAKEAGITTGMLYWTYKAYNGKIYYTRGIPSQRQVYTAGKMAKKKLPEIIEKNMRKAIESK